MLWTRGRLSLQLLPRASRPRLMVSHGKYPQGVDKHLVLAPAQHRSQDQRQDTARHPEYWMPPDTRARAKARGPMAAASRDSLSLIALIR
jgi:hypothetical protein